VRGAVAPQKNPKSPKKGPKLLFASGKMGFFTLFCLVNILVKMSTFAQILVTSLSRGKASDTSWDFEF
jgi:hypothetical protein